MEHFQLPFILADGYEVTIETKDFIAQDILFQHMIVPLGRFGEGLTLAMPIMTPYDVLSRIQQDQGCNVFVYVSLISENKKVLQEMYPDYSDWLSKDEERKQARRKDVSKQPTADDWMNIFDSGDDAVHDDRAEAK